MGKYETKKYSNGESGIKDMIGLILENKCEEYHCKSIKQPAAKLATPV